MTLFHLMYRSEMSFSGSDDDAGLETVSIIEAAQTRNTVDGLTGAIVVTGNSFVQVIEGPLDAVESTFERICCDLRHRRLQLLEFGVCEERAFGPWAMAQLAPSGELTRLCAGLETMSSSRVNAPTVAAVVKAMRRILDQSSADGRTTAGRSLSGAS